MGVGVGTTSLAIVGEVGRMHCTNRRSSRGCDCGSAGFEVYGFPAFRCVWGGAKLLGKWRCCSSRLGSIENLIRYMYMQRRV